MYTTRSLGSTSSNLNLDLMECPIVQSNIHDEQCLCFLSAERDVCFRSCSFPIWKYRKIVLGLEVLPVEKVELGLVLVVQ